MDAFTKAMRGAKLLVLADPANPTGCVFAPEDLEQVAFWARKHDVLIFQDASFDRLASGAGEGPAGVPAARRRPHPDVRQLFQEPRPDGGPRRLAGRHTGTWSARAPPPHCLSAPFVPSLCQQAALHALRTGEAAMAHVQSDFAARRAYVRDRLQEMGLEPWPAAGGFFFWVPVPNGETGTDFAQRLLSATGVLVNPGHVFGPSGRVVRPDQLRDRRGTAPRGAQPPRGVCRRRGIRPGHFIFGSSRARNSARCLSRSLYARTSLS